jgi:diaminopimelate epimerase
MTGEGIPFSKLNGSGNDFLLIDARDGALDGIDRPAFASKVCDRTRSVGADGLIVIEASRSADFRWDFYNADGSRAEMCGNGGRCAARFAAARKIAGPEMAFETLAGTIRACVSGRRVKLQMTRPSGLAVDRSLSLGGKASSIPSSTRACPTPCSSSPTSPASTWRGSGAASGGTRRSPPGART